MEEWQDTGIILTARMHSENDAIVSIITQNHGKYTGYINGARSKRKRHLIEPATFVNCHWKSKETSNLGNWKLEEIKPTSSFYMDEPLKLSAIQSACILYDQAIPDKEGHEGLFYGLESFINILENDDIIWLTAYIYWEIAFLKEIGYSLDLTKCAGGGTGKLIYVSPKSGVSVSEKMGEPYKDKLLKLPSFLGEKKATATNEDLLQALELTLYFLQNKAFAQHSHGIPEARLIFQQRFAKYIESLNQ